MHHLLLHASWVFRELGWWLLDVATDLRDLGWLMWALLFLWIAVRKILIIQGWYCETCHNRRWIRMYTMQSEKELIKDCPTCMMSVDVVE